jgi:hypothetical protein
LAELIAAVNHLGVSMFRVLNWTGWRALSAALLAALLVSFFYVNTASAGSGVPADKVVAAGSKRVVFGPGENVTLMTATMKTSKPTDVMIHTSLECSILTGLLTNNDNNSATATNTVRVWVEVDGRIVSLTQNSQPPQNGTVPPAGNDTDKVTFCDRTYSRTVTDDETPLNGIDQEDDYISTKSAHAFNWVQMNLGSGMHTIAVKAELEEATEGQAVAEAEIGNRTLIVEPTKMANDAVIQENGTS